MNDAISIESWRGFIGHGAQPVRTTSVWLDISSRNRWTNYQATRASVRRLVCVLRGRGWKVESKNAFDECHATYAAKRRNARFVAPEQ
jgi:hypothetical protein